MNDIISIHICDDDQDFLLKFKGQIEKYITGVYSFNISTFNYGKDLLNAFKHKAADIVFLDIDMPGLDGYDIAKSLSEYSQSVFIIFVTSHDDDVYRVWPYKPFWFLRKSHMEDLPTVLNELYPELVNRKNRSRNTCILKGENNAVEIDLNELIYLESYKHNLVLVYLYAQNKELRCKIGDAETQLFDYHIIRIQKGILVNCKFVSKVTSRDVLLHNGKSLPIGRDRITSVKTAYQKYLRET